MSTLVEVMAGVVPSVGVGLIFWFAVRSIIQADRRERAALADLDAKSARPKDARTRR